MLLSVTTRDFKKKTILLCLSTPLWNEAPSPAVFSAFTASLFLRDNFLLEFLSKGHFFEHLLLECLIFQKIKVIFRIEKVSVKITEKMDVMDKMTATASVASMASSLTSEAKKCKEFVQAIKEKWQDIMA